MTADGATSPKVLDEQGRPTGFLAQRTGRDTFVYPTKAMPYISAGVLDKQLFNLTELVEDGYDDKHSDRLPLIVRYADKSSRAKASASLDSAEKVLDLDSIQGAALKAERSDDFWTSITATSAKRSAGGAPTFGGGITKIWLDGKMRGTLAESTAQIGAPSVWAGGNTGAGVDVAVLDSGIDPDHPDLADRIVATKSFIEGETIIDRLGHGTHVASTIAGSGAASGGVEKGVAPGVRLHIGKVLGDDNFGSDSEIIAGMEWAAREQHAKIINLSLGDQPTDGTDPTSTAVNQLSAETGALFVIAAGNFGRESSIGAPAAADAALTVGAVTNTDSLASFSSQGPRLGDRAAKPDLTAPGVEIMAARSQYVSGSDGSYQLMSGTSMATPHVSGAAALVAAKHPDLNGQQLKQLLMSSVKHLPGMTPYQGGTGRLDVAAADAATVFASGSANFGYQEWNGSTPAPVTRPIRYTNISDTAVTLDLTASLDGLPASSVTLSQSRVTVPAHGTAEVEATVSFDEMPIDRAYGGYVTASTGSVQMRTTLSAGRESERHHLVVNTKDRAGRPLKGQLIVLSSDGSSQWIEVGASGVTDLRLPVDTYSAWFQAEVTGANGTSSRGYAILTAHGVKLDRDRIMNLDASKAKRVSATVPQPAEVTGSAFMLSQLTQVSGGSDWFIAVSPDQSYDSVWTLPTGTSPAAGFGLATQWRLTQPALTIAGYDDLRSQAAARPLPNGRLHLDAVLAGDRDTRGKAVVVRRDPSTPIEQQAAAAAAGGARLLVVVNDGVGRLAPWGGSIWQPAEPPPVTVATLTRDEGEQLISKIQRERRVKLDLTASPGTEYVYDLQHDYKGSLPADLTQRADRSNLARVATSFRNWQPGQVMEMRGMLAASGVATYVGSAAASAQSDRVDWVTAGKPWTMSVSIPGLVTQDSEWATYRAGATVSETWLGPVQRPRLVTTGETVVRTTGNEFRASVPGWGDSGAAHMGSQYADARLSLTLQQGSTMIARTDENNPVMSAYLPPQRLPYRLVSENSRGTDFGPYSTSTRTEWGFTSGQVTSGKNELPALIQLDYSVGTDRAGKADRRADLTVTPSLLAGAVNAGTMKKVTVEVSYDDGKTWKRADLRQAGAGWRTRLDAPHKAGFVTLRTTAADSKGNTVEQRITRAFGLK